MGTFDENYNPMLDEDFDEYDQTSAYSDFDNDWNDEYDQEISERKIKYSEDEEPENVDENFDNNDDWNNDNNSWNGWKNSNLLTRGQVSSHTPHTHKINKHKNIPHVDTFTNNSNDENFYNPNISHTNENVKNFKSSSESSPAVFESSSVVSHPVVNPLLEDDDENYTHENTSNSNIDNSFINENNDLSDDLPGDEIKNPMLENDDNLENFNENNNKDYIHKGNDFSVDPVVNPLLEDEDFFSNDNNTNNNSNIEVVSEIFNPMLENDDNDEENFNPQSIKTPVETIVENPVDNKNKTEILPKKEETVTHNNENNDDNSNYNSPGNISFPQNNIIKNSKKHDSPETYPQENQQPVENINNTSKNINSSSKNNMKVSVEKMREDGTFRKGRIVEPGDWNNFQPETQSNKLDTDVYSGSDADRTLGVPVDSGDGDVGERYIERAEYNAKTNKSKHKERYELLDSDFKKTVSSTVEVNTDGTPLNVESSYLKKYKQNENKRKNKDNGEIFNEKINIKEISFYKSLGHSKKEFKDSGTLLNIAGVDQKLIDEETLKKNKKRIDRAIGGTKALKRGSNFSFSARDSEILSFLAMFKYAKAGQLAQMFSTSTNSVRNNLRRLEASGLIVKENIINASAVYFLTEAGLLVSGYDLPRTTKSKVNWAMFPHQFTINYIAANLWGANINVLDLDDFPSKNRTDFKGKPIYGEQLVSELEIQSNFGKYKLNSNASIYKPQLLARMSSDFDEWVGSGGVDFGPSPEFFDGNEWMWILLNTGSELNYHVPDLVVKRQRHEDGTPASLAVEIELMNKNWDSYMKTLIAYKTDTQVFDKVIWVCKNMGTAEKLEKVAKQIGLWQEGRIKILPILTENGVFKGDLWTI